MNLFNSAEDVVGFLCEFYRSVMLTGRPRDCTHDLKIIFEFFPLQQGLGRQKLLVALQAKEKISRKRSLLAVSLLSLLCPSFIRFRDITTDLYITCSTQ